MNLLGVIATVAGSALAAGVATLAAPKQKTFWVTFFRKHKRADRKGMRLVGKGFETLDQATAFQNTVAGRGKSSILVKRNPDGTLDCSNPVRGVKGKKKGMQGFLGQEDDELEGLGHEEELDGLGDDDEMEGTYVGAGADPTKPRRSYDFPEHWASDAEAYARRAGPFPELTDPRQRTLYSRFYKQLVQPYDLPARFRTSTKFRSAEEGPVMINPEERA